MNFRSIFDAKISTTDSYVVFDFASSLGVGETLSSASTTAAVFSGTDATPSALVSGNPTISGGNVTQRIIDGTVGCTYILVCTATTSSNRHLMRDGYLTVKAAGS